MRPKAKVVGNHILIALIDVPNDIEDEFNRIYDETHGPDRLKVPGVKSAVRLRLVSSEAVEIARYMELYEVDDPDVPKARHGARHPFKGPG